MVGNVRSNWQKSQRFSFIDFHLQTNHVKHTRMGEPPCPLKPPNKCLPCLIEALPSKSSWSNPSGTENGRCKTKRPPRIPLTSWQHHSRHRKTLKNNSIPCSRDGLCQIWETTPSQLGDLPLKHLLHSFQIFQATTTNEMTHLVVQIPYSEGRRHHEIRFS